MINELRLRDEYNYLSQEYQYKAALSMREKYALAYRIIRLEARLNRDYTRVVFNVAGAAARTSHKLRWSPDYQQYWRDLATSDRQYERDSVRLLVMRWYRNLTKWTYWNKPQGGADRKGYLLSNTDSTIGKTSAGKHSYER